LHKKKYSAFFLGGGSSERKAIKEGKHRMKRKEKGGLGISGGESREGSLQQEMRWGSRRVFTGLKQKEERKNPGGVGGGGGLVG